MFALGYFPEGIKNPLTGTECAWWKDYGVPFVWETAKDMQEYLRCTRLAKHIEFHTLSDRSAFELSIQMVEVFSGRRRVQGSLRPVVNTAKADYARVMSILGYTYSL